MKEGDILNIGKVEIAGPDPQIIEVVKTILRQNEAILKMNADLLMSFAHPVWFVEREKRSEQQ